MRIILPGQQRVKTEEILSGWSHWEMRLYCLSLTRVDKRTESDGALCDPRKLILHGYKRFWWSQKRYEQTREAIIIARTELMFSGEFRLPLTEPTLGREHALRTDCSSVSSRWMARCSFTCDGSSVCWPS